MLFAALLIPIIGMVPALTGETDWLEVDDETYHRL